MLEIDINYLALKNYVSFMNLSSERYFAQISNICIQWFK